VLPFSNVVNFFSDKLARLSGWRFTFARILASPFQRFLLRHFSTPLLCTVRESFHNERVVRALRRKFFLAKYGSQATTPTLYYSPTSKESLGAVDRPW
jgi:hypothetical protein